MKFMMLILSIFIASRTLAQSACDTESECIELRDLATQKLQELRQISTPRYKWVENNSGFTSTAKLCESESMRLPTIRELALIAASQGAKGISETPSPGYMLIKKKGDEFYYNPFGFHAVSLPKGAVLISSTFTKTDSNGFETERYYYGLMPDGSIGETGDRVYVYNGLCVY